MSTQVSLVAEIRSIVGKGAARALRRNGQVPIVIYGKGRENIHASVSERDLNSYYFKSGYSSLTMNIKLGKSEYNVITRGVGLHPVTDRIEQADFMYIDKNTKIKVLVHVSLVGEEKCKGMKRGGVLNLVKRDVEILCSPENIPDNIIVDVSNLDINSSIHANDLTLPEGASIVAADQNYTIATIIGRNSQEEAEEEKK